MFTAVDTTYEAVGKHTYLTMTINSVLLGVSLLVFAALYKQLAPRVYNIGSDGNTETATVIKLKRKLVLGIAFQMVIVTAYNCHF